MATNADGTWSDDLTASFKTMVAEQSPVAFLVFQEMKRGKSCAKAIDFVCGDGSFKKFASEVWAACRAQTLDEGKLAVKEA